MSYKNHPNGKNVTYRITIRHRGELTEKYLERLKNELWEYFGDIGKDDIQIKRTYNKKVIN